MLGQHVTQIKSLVDSLATYLEGAGRESIVKLWSRYGMKQKYIITGKSL